MGALEFNLAVTGHEEEKHPEQVTSPLRKERPCPEVTLLKEIPKSFFFNYFIKKFKCNCHY